jgi:hypothetical protein
MVIELAPHQRTHFQIIIIIISSSSSITTLTCNSLRKLNPLQRSVSIGQSTLPFELFPVMSAPTRHLGAGIPHSSTDSNKQESGTSHRSPNNCSIALD